MDTESFKLKKKLTGKAKLVEESRRAYHHFLKTVAQDRLYLLAIVTGGKARWKEVATKAFSGFLIDDILIDQMFEMLVEQAGPDPVQQYDELQRSELVALKLDKLKGLARFITSEAHLDEVLDRCVPDGDERRAIRTQMLILMRTPETQH